MKSKKKILVTGGNGFIGTNLIIELLKDKNNKILNFDKFSYCSNSYLLKKKNKNLKNIKANLLNFDITKKIIFNFRPDLIFHLAAETHVDVSLINPLSHYDNNVKTTLNLLTIINLALNKRLLKKNFRFIYIGTDEIYGDINFNSKKNFKENQPLDPNNPYSASKAAAVLMVKTWFKNFNLPCIITNSVNNFGPFQFIEKFIPRSIMLSKNYNNIELYGKGKNIRTWISVHDHVDALIYLSKYGKKGEIYNISSSFKLTNLDIAKKIQTILKKKKIYTKLKFVIDRLGHDHQYSVSANKLIKLGWKPKYQFHQKLNECINWYCNKKNLKFFKNINQHLVRKGFRNEN